MLIHGRGESDGIFRARGGDYRGHHLERSGISIRKAGGGRKSNKTHRREYRRVPERHARRGRKIMKAVLISSPTQACLLRKKGAEKGKPLSLWRVGENSQLINRKKGERPSREEKKPCPHLERNRIVHKGFRS